MRKFLYIYILLYSSFCFSQTVYLTEAKSIGNNKDKFLYALQKEPDSTVAHYLGKIEVSGFSNNDVAVFGEISRREFIRLYGDLMESDCIYKIDLVHFEKLKNEDCLLS